jgi:hypothetical protein
MNSRLEIRPCESLSRKLSISDMMFLFGLLVIILESRRALRLDSARIVEPALCLDCKATLRSGRACRP